MAFQRCSKIVLTLFLILVLLLLSLIWAVRNPGFLSWVTKRVINKYSSEIIIEAVSINQVQWFSWQKVSLKQLKLKSQIRSVEYQFFSSEIVLDSLGSLFRKEPISVIVKDLNIVSKDLTLNGIEAETHVLIDRLRYNSSLTQVSITQLKYKGYSINKIKGSLNDTNGQVSLSNVYGNLYGGSMVLNGWFKYLTPMSYENKIHLDHVDSSLLAQANPSFAQLTAVIDGDIKLKNFKNSGLDIQANLQAPSGGKMKASLLMFLAQYVPQRQQIEGLIERNELIPLEKAEIIVTSLSSEKISSQVSLKISSINLNMNIKFDFNIEGGLENLLEYVH